MLLAPRNPVECVHADPSLVLLTIIIVMNIISHSLMKTPGLGSKRLCFGPLSVPKKNEWLELFPERLS